MSPAQCLDQSEASIALGDQSEASQVSPSQADIEGGTELTFHTKIQSGQTNINIKLKLVNQYKSQIKTLCSQTLTEDAVVSL